MYCPLLIALPGIVTETEKSRIDDILRDLSSNGIKGIRIDYTEEEVLTDKTLCHINLRGAEEKIRRTLEENISHTSKIGLISNSTSAIPVTRYLLNPLRGVEIAAYVSISPLLGWEYFANPEQRKFFEQGNDIQIASRAGENRVIPNNMILELKQVDCLASLQGYKPNSMQVMTILGKKDTRASPESIRKYHSLLGGLPENLIELDTEHNVPNSGRYAIDFLKKALIQQS